MIEFTKRGISQLKSEIFTSRVMWVIFLTLSVLCGFIYLLMATQVKLGFLTVILFILTVAYYIDEKLNCIRLEGRLL